MRLVCHWLVGYYRKKIGHYTIALQHYQQAYSMYALPRKQAIMLENMAWCHKDAGNYKAATGIARKAAKRYRSLQDTALLARALHLLANCQRSQKEFAAANTSYRQALQAARQSNPKELPRIYSDYSQLKEATHQLDSAVYYQRYALDKFAEKDLAKKSINYIRLAWYYLHQYRFAAARRCLRYVRTTLKPRSPKAWVYWHGVRGLLQYLQLQEAAARQSYARFDSLLHSMHTDSTNLVQRRFSHYTAHTIYKGAYTLMKRSWVPYKVYKPYFERIKNWYHERSKYEKKLFDGTKGSITLQDSLVVVAAKPTTIVHQTKVHRVSLSSAIAAGAVLCLCIAVVYYARRHKLHAHAHFVATIKRSPIRGYEDITSREINILMNIEERLNRHLTDIEAKVLVLIARKNKYNQIAVAVNSTTAAIKTRVKRLKDDCGVNNIRDLMPGNKGGKKT